MHCNRLHISKIKKRTKQGAAFRLQTHLVDSEESHTREFILATENEKELRNELATVREELLVANSTLHSLRYVLCPFSYSLSFSHSRSPLSLSISLSPVPMYLYTYISFPFFYLRSADKL